MAAGNGYGNLGGEPQSFDFGADLVVIPNDSQVNPVLPGQIRSV
ncbi:hypothetical protein [Yaniella flava]